MAEEDKGDKTEEPTPRRRQEAREEGDLAKSQDLAAAVLLVGLLLLMAALGPDLFRTLGNLTAHMLSTEIRVVRGDDLIPTIEATILALARSLGPILVAVALAAMAANLAQVGFLWAPKKLNPNPQVLNPIKGFQKLFLEPKTYFGFLMNLCKLGLTGAVAWYAVSVELGGIVGLTSLEIAPAVAAGAWIVFRIGIKIAVVLLVLAILDYAYQKWQHEQKLKMTKQQVKDEMKRMEGDPHLKARRRQIAMQRSMQRIRQDVPSADVVVTNPTHYAVALKYDEATMAAPRVVAKGTDLMAMRIRELALANGVPIVERPPLARALFSTVEVGREIPEDFFSAVAELLAYVYQLEQQAAAASPARSG